MSDLLQTTPDGLWCAAGGFHIDPWRAVERALITHAHSDHARAGSASYLTSRSGTKVLRARIGDTAPIESIPFGDTRRIGDVTVSFHPAGHVLGSAQIRIEHRGEVWVVSGDYKTAADGITEPFEPVRCHTFITESTFGLPVYRWRPQAEVFAEINAWWRANQSLGRASVIFAYSLGKAQRILANVDASIGPIFVHGAVETFLPIYRDAGVRLPEIIKATPESRATLGPRALVVAPQSADASPWLRKFGDASTAFASGWMQVRGARRWRSADRGFVLSDHADWPGLNDAIRATGAERVLVTHGQTAPMVRWLRGRGLDADVLETRFRGEAEEGAPEETAENLQPESAP
jgi:putative mRNA 3-end processing factor